MRQNHNNLLPWLAILVPVTVVLAFHAYLGSYTRFIADDYCSAYLGRRLGILRYIWFWYLNWGGRFSAIAADMLLAWLQPQGIGFVTATALIVWSAGLTITIYYLIFHRQHTLLRWLISLTLGLIVIFVIILLTPNPPQSFYWYSAFRTHTLPIIVFTLYTAAYSCFRSYQVHKATRLVWLISSFALAFFNAGFSEAFTVMQIIILTVSAGLEKTTKTDTHQANIKFLLAGLAGAALALLIMLTAPGNANRQEAFHQPSGLPEIISISIDGYLSLWNTFFTSPEKMIALLGAALGFFSAGTQCKTPRKPSTAQIMGAILLGWLLPLASFLPAAYGIGDALPERAHPIPIFFITAALSIAAFQFGTRYTGRDRSKWTTILSAIMLLISAIMTLQQISPSRHIFIEYAERMDRVEQDILTARQNGRQVIHIPQLRNWAGTFDPTDNPKFFSTACISLYYDIQVIGPNPDEP